MPQFKMNAQHYCAKPHVKNPFRINGIYTLISRSIRTKLRKACSQYNGEEKCILCLVRGLREKQHFKDIGVDRMIILKWINKK
jgi:hypothetical protein